MKDTNKPKDVSQVGVTLLSVLNNKAQCRKGKYWSMDNIKIGIKRGNCYWENDRGLQMKDTNKPKDVSQVGVTLICQF